ncbi:ABC transporter substrate-binding protein [Luteococcus sp. OSA5]|uniref:ABC transporter substrate-binding protein n=1 Tax=Luteococcus sp. OSA5 TaxID=3401630 RepID=UPI003B43735F
MTNGTFPTATRRDFLRLTTALGAAMTFAGTLSACGTSPADRADGSAESAAAGNPDGTITTAISYELGTNGFDPMTTSAALTVAANWHTMEGLTEVLPSGTREIYPALAKELPKKVDEHTWEATLREGAKFHDGSPVTAEDVVFSFERVLDPKNQSLYVQFISFLDGVTAKDDKTITFKLKAPFSLVPQRLAVVKIVPKALVSKDAKAFDAKPVGSGPWKLTDNSATSKQLAFERFDDYNGSRPAKAAKMVWKVMPDDSTRINAMSSKAVQAIDQVPDLSVETLKANAKVEAVQGFSLLFAMFNVGSAPFKEVRNRQAFLYALDMDKIIKTAYLDNASPATSFLHETHPDYKKAKTVYSYDVGKAKALFKETGLSSIRLLCTDHGWVKKATPIIKECLEAAGLKVDFTEKKSADVYNTIDGKPAAYDAVIAPGDPSVFGSDPSLLLRWWYSNETWTDNRMHWKGQPSHKKVQELLDKAESQEGEEQKATWGELFDLISETVPLYPLLHRKPSTAWDDSSLVDFKPISLTGLSLIDVASTK